MNILQDETYMRLALDMARATNGQTGINPMVGCVIVKDGRIIGTGAHLRMGQGHAEINALSMAEGLAEGSTVYVTLEPCSHFGRTPPCCNRLIAEKVARVVVAAVDPNALVAGTGIARMRDAGIQVEVGLLADEAGNMNEKYNKYIRTRLPFVTMKTASTLDGKIASKSGDSRWISNEEARAHVHTLRHQHQAIMVGASTVITDNPRLTTRLAVPGLDPVRIVADSRLRIPETAELLQTPGVLILTTESASSAQAAKLEALGAEVIVAGNEAVVDLALAMRLLGERGIGSILLEGGGRLNGAMLAAELIDKCILFYAPTIIGGSTAPANFSFDGFTEMSDAIRLQRLQVQTFADNICISGYPSYREAIG